MVTIDVDPVTVADTTPPTVSCGAPDGQWHGDNVAIPCTASDDDSGLADPGDASFDLVTSLPAGEESADVPTDSRQVCDGAGNCTTAGPIAGNMIDRKAPTVTITTPADGATYAQGSTVIADYTCSDGGSGVGTCDGPVPDGALHRHLDPGAKVFTVTTADLVSNSDQQDATYTTTIASGRPVAADDAYTAEQGATLTVPRQVSWATTPIPTETPSGRC